MDPRLRSQQPWLARILPVGGRHASGGGVLLSPRLVLTCAHVVQADRVRVELPSVGYKGLASKLSTGWFPVDEDGKGDIALLELDHETGAAPAPLRIRDDLEDRRFAVRGFPAGRETIEATGLIRRPTGPGDEWVQIEDTKTAGVSISRGFSGSPVWATDLDAVVGIVVAERPTSERVGHMIPLTTVAQYWKPLLSFAGWRLDLDDDLDTHWLPRARGVEPESESTGWYFTGRRRALETVSTWLNQRTYDDRRIRFITGAPGSGKSAIVSRLVVLADRHLGPTVPLDPVDLVTMPTAGSIHFAIHAKGKTLREIVSAIALAADVQADDPDHLVVELKQRRRPFTLVVDALDEAAENAGPALARLLSRIALDADGIGMRVVIGARSGASAGPTGEVLDGLGERLVVLRIDQPPLIEERDLSDYARRRLLLDATDSSSTPYRDDVGLATSVAKAVAERSFPLFLVAQLACRTLVNRPSVLDTNDPVWMDRLPADVGQAMEDYLDGFGPRRQWARDLLTAVAYAEGDGLPANEVWATLASALAGRPYRVSDVGDVISSASAYLIEATAKDSSGATTRYRLFHEALAEHLRSSRQESAGQRLVAESLLGIIPGTTNGARDWSRADPYIANHLASHAAAGGLLLELIRDVDFLVSVDPRTLVPRLRIPPGETSEVVAIYRSVAPEFYREPRSVRASLLELGARKRGNDLIAADVATRLPNRPWETLAARWDTSIPHVQITVHDAPISALQLAAIGDRVVIISGDSTGVLRLTDLATLSPLTDGVRGHGAAITAIGVSSQGLQSQIVTGDAVANIATWSLTPLSRQEITVDTYMLPWRSDIRALTVAQARGTTYFVGGGWEGSLCLWDAGTGVIMTELLHPPDAALNALALGGDADRPTIVTGHDDGLVRFHDLTRPFARGKARATYQDSIESVATGAVRGRSVAITGGHDGSIRLWDLEKYIPLGLSTQAHAGPIMAIATNPTSPETAMTWSSDGMWRFWDLAEMRSSGALALRHPDQVTAASGGWSAGRPFLVTGDSVGRLRIWDSTGSSESVGREMVRINRAQAFVADTTNGHMAITFHADARARTWSGETLEPLGEIYIAHQEDCVGSTVARFHQDAKNGLIVVGCRHGAVIVSQFDGHVARRLVERVPPVWMPVESIALARFGKRLHAIVGDAAGTMSVHDLEDPGRHVTLPGELEGPINFLAIHQDGGRAIAVGASTFGSFGLWDLAQGIQIADLEVEAESRITAIAVTGNAGGSEVLLGDMDGVITSRSLVDIKSGVVVLARHSGQVTAMAAGTIGERNVVVSGGTDGTVRISDLGGTDREGEVVSTGSPVDGVAVDADGTILAACADGLLRIRLLRM
jgi:WD40 repeat protein